MKFKAILLASTLLAGPVHAGEFVLGVDVGMNFMGDSGISSVSTLHRDEVATTKSLAVSLGYQAPLVGGRIRGMVAYDTMHADGDWGVSDGGDTARQTVDVISTGFSFGVEYDIKQVEIGAFYPFVGAAFRFNNNRSAISTVIDHADGSQTGCAGDDPDTWSFGYHGRAGLAADYGRVTARVFYQYTDRGYAKVTGDNCPSWRGQPMSPGNFHAKDHSIRIGLSVAL